MRPRILIIDDENSIRRTLAIALRSEGFDVAEAATAFDAKRWLTSTGFSTILLDLGLPDEEGQTLLKKIRSVNLSPVIVLSVRDSIDEKIQALDNGAQDYMTKPFSVAELLARIRAVMRDNGARGSLGAELVTDGVLSIDCSKRTVSVLGTCLDLTPKEYEVLVALATTPNVLVTQRQLLCDIWGPTYVEHAHYLRIVISHLRRKIGALAKGRTYIATVQGTGYRLLLNQSAS